MVNQPEGPLDNPVNSPIVRVSEQNKETPPGGDTNTHRGLTSQADGNSMEATQDPISALSSRQLLSPAVDGFFDRKVEYCPPPDRIVWNFANAVCDRLNEQFPGQYSSTEVRQGFRQFLEAIINLQVERANKRRAR